MSQPQNITFDVPNAFELEKLSELHKAMGDFTRMKILWQLMQGEQCVNDLAKTLSLTNSAISHQLHALRITKLVRSRKARKRVFYSLQDEHIQWILEETIMGLRQIFFYRFSYETSSLIAIRCASKRFLSAGSSSE